MSSSSFLDDVAIPTFTNGLKTFEHILTQAAAYAKTKGLDANAEFPSARLIEDQLPLTFQVQNATKAVKTNLTRLTGVEFPAAAGKETTLEDLHALIRETLALLKTFEAKKGAYKAQEDASVEVPFGGKNLKFSAKDAVLSQGIPNFLFHVTTGYSILRAKGVPLGKSDYIRNFIGQ